MSGKIEIRGAKASDFPEIELLLEELIGKEVGPRKKFFLESLKCRLYFPFIAIYEGKVAGFADLYGMPDAGHGAVLGVIKNMVVGKQYRSRGIGGALIDHILRFAKKRKFHEVHVWTETENKRAQRFYQKHGLAPEAILFEKEM